jgi:two-component system, LytTR family, response regulator
LDSAPVKRDRVLELFWPDLAQARGGANLNLTLYRIRKALGQEFFVLEGQSYVLKRDNPIEYDVKAFELAAQQALATLHGSRGRAALLATAYRLYTGEFLADMPVDWAQSRRRDLADLYLQLVDAYGKELISLTRYIEARQVIEQGLSIDPYDDQLHEQMLTCLGELGRRSALIDHYVRYRERLRSEFGLEPPSSITALYARLIQ